MEPFDKDELSDQELNLLLREWKVPSAPERLRRAVFPDRSRPWWKIPWSVSFRLPLPVAVAIFIVAGLGAWRSMVPVKPRVIVKTERVEVPVVKEQVVTRTVYRNRIVTATRAAMGRNVHELQPVAELRPVIFGRNE